MRTVHELTYEEQFLHQLDEYHTSGGALVKWTGTPLGANKGINTWNLVHPQAPRLYLLQERDTENPLGMGANEYAWGHTWSSAKLALELTEALEKAVLLLID